MKSKLKELKNEDSEGFIEGIQYKTVEGEGQGRCPHCDSENLDYQGIEIEGDYCWYPFWCDDCGGVGSEDYKMVYLNSEVDVEVMKDGK